MSVLVVNGGSATIKFAVYTGGDTLERRIEGLVDDIGGRARLKISAGPAGAAAERDLPAAATHEMAMGAVLDLLAATPDLPPIGIAGHRVVHGGTEFLAPVIVDEDVLLRLDALVPLAPLHQPHNLAAIRAVSAVAPSMMQIACFDTAFHATQPEIARLYALPRALSESGIKRYGFHGLSYESIARTLPTALGPRADGKVIVAHLGNGASLCAMKNRRSIATTMGFTPLDGVPMGTRCGAIDPGVILHLIEQRGMSAAEVTELLYHRSGLLGVSGVSNDMRTLLASRDKAAALAVDLFAYRIAREIGSLAAAIGGIDALVFTGGIGENAAPVRAKIGALCEWLGLSLDSAANARNAPRIEAEGSAIAALVLPTDEGRVIAAHALALAG